MNISQAISNCTPQAISSPVVFGAEFLAIEAKPIWNYTLANDAPALGSRVPDNSAVVSFCNITLAHTHPGQNDTLHTTIWLPLSTPWNNRWVMAGGGGWAASGPQTVSVQASAIYFGYATSSVDGSVQNSSITSPASWALSSPGNVDYNTLQDFAMKGLIDGALATKSVIKSFFGNGPQYSYWMGCSQGGRQGQMFAQRFPDVFDGIASNAPAVNWNSFFFNELFPQQVLYELDLLSYPHPCEYDSLTLAAISACDANDGLIDGLISDPDRCTFDPQTLVGTPASQCQSSNKRAISKAAALAMTAFWKGPHTSNGTQLWFGNGYEANATAPMSVLATTCANNGTCVPVSSELFSTWIRYFVAKNPDYDVRGLTREEWVSAFKAGDREYASIINTNSPDLSEFRASGGKLLTYHGLADQLIPFGGTRDFYNRVSALDPEVRDFFRYFEAPGAAHCAAGRGGIPEMFTALTEWVEKGIAPETLTATNGDRKERLLCLYPQQAVFKGDSSNYTANDFVCE